MKSIYPFIIVLMTLHACKENKTSNPYNFDFGSDGTAPGFVQVDPAMTYPEAGYFGFYNAAGLQSESINGNKPPFDDMIISDKPFYFVCEVPEGNYDVKIYAGSSGTSELTVKAESRRLMVKNLNISAGEVDTIWFTTNVRYPVINDSTSVSLKSKEYGHFNWDSLLNIEFNGDQPAIYGLEITRNDKAITLFLAGNSTVTDQRFEPYSAWGQMLPYFFKPGGIAVANHAESGEALKSFTWEHRLQKIMSTIRPGDYLFIQFAHNDQKPNSSAYLEANTGYKEYLRKFIQMTRDHDAIPVLVTPMHRRNFDGQGNVINTHGDYPEAMRQVALEEGVALIDLNNMSRDLYESLGPEESKKLFVHYAAGTFPGQDEELKDDSHHSSYGAYELARCVVKGIRENLPDLAEHLKDGTGNFNPYEPDDFNLFSLPVSPLVDSTTPEGR